MAVIQQTDPMFINFTQSASEVMRLRNAMESGQLKRARQSGRQRAGAAGRRQRIRQVRQTAVL